MEKIDNEIYNSYNWIKKVRYDQSEKAWRKYASKFSIAVMRILRLDKINQKDLVEKANLDEKQLAEILKGKVNLDVKVNSVLSVGECIQLNGLKSKQRIC